jgi:hypothetical protein
MLPHAQSTAAEPPPSSWRECEQPIAVLRARWTLQLTRNSAQRTLLADTLRTMQNLENVWSHAQSTAAEPPPAS